MNFIEELRWRGMLQDVIPGTEEQLNKEVTTGYIGFDPTADSLHVGSLVQIMILMHFQRAGHKPIALIGGATGMIGDPSGKKEERKLLSFEDVKNNEAGIKKQLEKFLDFNKSGNPAEIVNNGDWFNSIHTITFLRDVGKFISVNYLLSKGFVKDRLNQEQELSFTEFNYILMQAYDFFWLFQNKNCKVQMGGSDQWGNITAGVDLIRKKIRGTAFAVTCPLMTKADGGKFGKTEKGNIWLDRKKTSPYKFYQFWINTTDADISKYIRTFSLKTREEIESLEEEHKAQPHLRKLQKSLAEEITIRVHSEEDLKKAMETTEILFGSSFEDFKKLSPEEIEDAFDEDLRYKVELNLFHSPVDPITLLGEKTTIYPSKSETKKAIQGNGVSINKNKINADSRFTNADLLYGKFLLAQKGKNKFFLIIAE